MAYYGLLNIAGLSILYLCLKRAANRLGAIHKALLYLLFLADALCGIIVSALLVQEPCPLSAPNIQPINALAQFAAVGAGYTLPYYILAIIISSLTAIVPLGRIIKNKAALFTLAVFLPGCGCASFPIALSLKNERPFDSYAFFILSSLLTPFAIVMGLGILGIQYAAWRILISCAFAFIAAYAISLASKKHRCHGAPSISLTTQMPATTRQDIFDSAIMLFTITFIPVLSAIAISALLQAVFSYEAISKAFLFPSRRLIAVSIAWLARFCGSQDIVILAGLRSLPIGEAQRQAFSLAANGFCLSLLPIYAALFSRKGAVWYALLTLTAAGALSLIRL